MKNITILGSTGSIGVSTLEVISLHPDRFQVFALCAKNNVERMFEQCQAFNPRYAVMLDENAAEKLQQKLEKYALNTQVLCGSEAFVFVASHTQVDYVMAAIVGAAGLLPVLAAAKAAKRILLANKEALVLSGSLLIEAVQEYKAELLPVDSEHNAIFQCLPLDFQPGSACSAVKRIILTASGGAFRDLPLEELENVTPEQACQHPNWVMGRKITVDSATMMNKGLELIEAKWLFGLAADQLDVVIHPQSLVHSFVEYQDGSLLAQLGLPDMRIPIAYSLSWPQRIKSGVAGLDLLTQNRLDFAPLCTTRFPCLKIAREALLLGGTATAILNAANEIAVEAFLNNKLKFTDIPKLIEKVMETLSIAPVTDLEQVIAVDLLARKTAEDLTRTLLYSPCETVYFA